MPEYVCTCGHQWADHRPHVTPGDYDPHEGVRITSGHGIRCTLCDCYLVRRESLMIDEGDGWRVV